MSVETYKALMPVPKKHWWQRQRYDRLRVTVFDRAPATVYINGKFVKP